MPNKTIYVKESDLPLYEKISASGEDSVSAMFAEFLRFEDVMRQPQKIQFTPMPEVATLRDQFAMAALTGSILLLKEAILKNAPGGSVAKSAYALADDMMKERSK